MKRFGTVRRIGCGSLVLTLLGSIGCGEAMSGPGAKGPGADSPQAKVLACYEREFRRTQEKAPTIDDKDRKAADDLIERQHYKIKRICSLIQSTLSGKNCGLSPKFQSVAECIDRNANQPDDLNNADKSQMDTRIRMRENYPNIPGTDR